jgi:ligand-binding sensor domain-containing protein
MMAPTAMPNRLSFLLALLLSMVAAAPAAGQEVHFGIQTYGPREGFAQRRVSGLAMAADGRLWVAAENAVQRFDGTRLEILDRNNMPRMAAGHIAALATDVAGNLWVALDGEGLLVMRAGTRDLVTVVTPTHAGGIRHLVSDKAGNLWMSSIEGLVRWRDGKPTGRWGSRDGLGMLGVSASAVDDTDTVWLVSSTGVFRLDGSRVVPVNVPLDHPDFVAPARAGGVWVASRGGLIRCRADGTIVERVGVAEGWQDRGLVHAFSEGGDGRLWIGLRQGLGQIADGRVRAYYDKTNGLPDDWVTELIGDADGNVWIGTAQGGLARLWQTEVASIGATEGLPSSVIYSISEDTSGAIWIGTASGLARLANGAVRTFGRTDGLHNTAVAGLGPDRDGAMWVGTESGLGKYRNGAFTWHDEAGLDNRTVHAVLQDRTGRVWAATSAGLYVSRGGPFALLPDSAGVSSASRIDALVEDQAGTLWITTTALGLARWDGSRFVQAPSGGPPLATIPQTLLADQSGTLWIGTASGGLWRFSQGTYTEISMRQGLVDDAVNAVIDDGLGNVWVAGARGIQRVTRASVDAVAEGRASRIDVKVYGISEGMRDPETTGGTQPAAWRTRDGRMWFSTVEGVAILDPRRPNRPVPAPQAFLGDVSVDGRRLSQPERVVVPADTRQVEVRFHTTNFAAPERVRFRYKLEGLRSDWVYNGANRTVSLANLGPGDYRFQVQASVERDTWGVASRELPITVQPRFWQTAWFMALVVLAAIGTVLLVHRGRVRLIDARARELKIKVDEALAEVHTLSGLLPVCAWCRKARDDQGYWKQLELYIQERTDARVTHGLCPECSQKLQLEIGDVGPPARSDKMESP